MPDLQTEVKKIINAWNLPKEEVVTTPIQEDKQTFSRKIYEFIKDNPQCSFETLRHGLGIELDNTGSLASTVKSLYDRQLIGRAPIPNPSYKGIGRRLVFVYWAVATTYTTQIKGLYSKKKDKAVKIEGVREKKVKTKALKVKANKPAAAPVHATPAFDAQAFVNSLNVYDARHVYQLLDIVFGKQGS